MNHGKEPAPLPVRQEAVNSLRYTGSCLCGGTISEPLNVRPAANYDVGCKCNWWDIDDALPSFDSE